MSEDAVDSAEVSPEKLEATLQSLSRAGLLPRTTALQVGAIRIVMLSAVPEKPLSKQEKDLERDDDTLFASST